MLEIRPLRRADLQSLSQFTDREIGAGYFTPIELEKLYENSQSQGVMCSLVLVNHDDALLGVRITLPPGQWGKGKGQGLHPEQWPHPQERTAYFQSLFLAREIQGQGWGGQLSRGAMERLRQIGTKGIVTHSWKESPANSSTRYLKKLGFVAIADHPLYWQDVDYNCTRCLRPPCLCTAQEMYLDLERIE
jgi:ribosomal protein S18 acetylase RimI-like enzyme